MQPMIRPASLRYGVAVAAVGLAIASRLALDPVLGDQFPFATLFLAVLVVAGYAGRGPALLATGLGGLASAYFVMAPRWSLAIRGVEGRAGLALYLVVGAGIALLGGSLRAARRRTEADAEAVVRQEQWLRVTLASIGDAVIATDAQGRVSLANPVAEALVGWTRAEAAGRRLDEVLRIVDEATRRPVADPARRVLDDGGGVAPIDQPILIARDGSERAIEYSAAPIRLGDGSIAGAVLVFRDVTARRRADRALASNEQRLRLALDAARMVAWEWSPADGSLLVSENAGAVFGLPAGTTLLRIDQGLSLLHPDDVPGYRAAYQRALDERGGYLAHYRLIRPDDGRVLWMEERGHTFGGGAGGDVGLVGVVMDVTGERLAEAELRASEEQRRLALDSAEMGTWSIDSATGALTTDERCRTIFLGRPGPLDLEAACAVIHPDDRGRIRDRVGAAMQPDDPAPSAEEFRVVLADGTIRWVLARGRANYEATPPPTTTTTRRRLVSFDGTAMDVTERKRLEDGLRQFAADLSDADHRKDEFLATLAHELRNPLAPLRNGLQIMKLAAADPLAVDESRSLMERQVGHMVRLIDDLMDVSRITRNKLVLRRERVDLAMVVRNAVDTSRPLLDEAGHELAVTLPARPTFVDADVTRLAQVFANLLNNAAKYTERGGHIALVAEHEGGDVVVTVHDDGVGIPPEVLPKLFVMFTQVDRSLERSQGGLGIGLSLVKTLVEMHGGSVEARSRGQGLGSEFVVRLPIVVVGTLPAGRPDEVAARLDPPSRLRILVVDDNRDSARTLARLLKLLGHETRSAHDGGEAVEVAEAYRPGLILLDIGMPVMNGYEVARTIRERPWGKDVRIVALTGWGQDGDRKRSVEAGFDRHLVKPVDPTDLEDLLTGFAPPPAIASDRGGYR